MPPLRIEELQKIEKQRREIKKEIYKKIYEQLTKKIKLSVEMSQKQVFLRVPTYVVGYPTYDVKKATDYIERQFNLGGFIVHRVSEVDIYVSWQTKKKSRPSAMAPSTQEEVDDDSLPTLINLKKLASKYKNA